jgi:Tol biopolymer transport system component
MSIGRRWKGFVGATGLAAVLALAFGGGDGHAQTQLKGWTTPVNLGSIVNSAYNDDLPHLSQDGGSLYFISNRSSGTLQDFDIWVSHRLNGLWRRPRKLGPNINTTFNERGPCLSPDGHYLFFSSDRTDLPGNLGTQDLWVSYRDDVSDDGGWQVPVNLGPAVNTTDADFGAALLGDPNGKLSALLFGRRVGGGQADIYMSPYLHGSFRPATPVTELNSEWDDLRPTIRPDGLQLFFSSDRPGLANSDIWVSTRADILSPWSTPVNVGHPINTEFAERVPAVSADGGTLIFSSDRPGSLGSGTTDLWVSTRQKIVWP